ncbi:phosphate signaling complex protein PhoU [Desulfovibrio intestinalis]|uniref:Phosphate transport system protein n=1 Tax=Desulfovibrio intestinalis TaxID=58621 RepID=A0A7W8C0W2_9BACT|nr:phosphate signaling complex protein PhoU [Desulfovibrio intestinalis]MBB5143221.1 phosphate transport system protein [Desulfovibrio intestinalis]
MQQANYLQQLLVTLRTRLLVMCASVGIALEEAGKALAANDPGRAAAVIESDASIDALENEIDEMALRLLARSQPVASDLRFVVTSLRMVVDLERIGDEAVSMAEQAILMQDMPGFGVIPHVRELYTGAREAFENSVRVFRENDAQGALAMSRGDDEAVQNEVRIIQGIMECLSDPQCSLEPHLAMHIILVTRSLTRIWRRSINIAEHVYFISRGESLKHKGENREEGLSVSGGPVAAAIAAVENMAENSKDTSAATPVADDEKSPQRRRRTEKDTENV